MRKICVILILLLVYSAVPTQAAEPADTLAIRKVVDQLFDGMRLGDSARVAATLASEVTFTSISLNKKDSLVVHHENAGAGFLKAVGTPHKEKWDERIYDVQIKTDGPMAIVWAPYKFYLGDKFSHCGVNVFTLIRRDENWKILEITDTRRKTDCP